MFKNASIIHLLSHTPVMCNVNIACKAIPLETTRIIDIFYRGCFALHLTLSVIIRTLRFYHPVSKTTGMGHSRTQARHEVIGLIQSNVYVYYFHFIKKGKYPVEGKPEL